MVIKKNEEVIYTYNQEGKVLVILFINGSNLVYTIGGWFGKKLDEFLASDGDVEQFLGTGIFKENGKLRENFERLLVTLIGKSIFNPPEGDTLVLIKPFLEEEYAGFGEGDMMGSLTIMDLSQSLEEFEAFAHYCDPAFGGDCYHPH